MTSPIQMAGLSNGLDVQSIIDKLLEVESTKITTVQERKVDLEADVAAWGDISSIMTTLTDALDDLRDLDTWNKMLATASDMEKLSVTASSSATPAVYSMTISSLAQAHSVGTDTAATISGNSAATSTTNLVGTGLTAGETFTIEGQVITIDATTESLSTLASKINTAAASMDADKKVTASIIGDRLIITRNDTGSTEIAMSDTSGTPLIDLGILQSTTTKPQPPSGNVLWLEMETNGAGTVIDSSGNNNTGSAVGDAGWTPSGKFDGAYTLDGIGDAITVPKSGVIDGYGSFTWSVWVNSSSATTQTLMHYGDRNDGAGITLQLEAGGQPRIYIKDAAGNTVNVTGSADLSDGQWHLVTVTNDGATLQIYEDGVATNSVNSTSVGYITTNDHDDLEIGRRWNDAAYSDFLNGSIDEVMAFNRNLSADEVLALKDSFTTVSYKNELLEAQDAVFTVNGAGVTRSSNTNLTDVISNVTLNLLETASSSDGLKLTIAQDTLTPKTAIETFVVAYNAAVNKLQAYIDIDLTDPDNPVTAQLQGDTMVGTILYSLRRLVGQTKNPYMDSSNASYTYNSSTGILDSLSDIGVWTEGKESTIAVTDSARLDYMLGNYFDKVKQLMRGVYSEQDGYQHGVAGDLYNYTYGLSTSLTGEIAKHVDAIETRINTVDDQIEKMLSDIDKYEQRLWSQFGAMDDAVGSMQAQLNYIAAITGSLSK